MQVALLESLLLSTCFPAKMLHIYGLLSLIAGLFRGKLISGHVSTRFIPSTVISSDTSKPQESSLPPAHM